MAEIDVGQVEELPPGSVKIVHAGEISVGVYNLGGRFCAIEDRCSHDDGPLCEGDFDPDEGYAVCPRHGARIEICTGRPLSLPAVEPVETFPVRVEDGMVKGRKADEIAALPKEELLEEIGIPLTPIRLKCALLGLGVLKVALHRAKGTALPDEWAGLDELELK